MATNEVKIEIIKSLKSSIENEMKKLPGDQLYSYRACIYKVSAKPRKANKAAFEPRLVSIGPLHSKKPQLHAMESYKIRCLQNFLIRFGVGLHDLLTFVTDEESFVRSCYEDSIKLKPKQFSEMILFDGIFIIELFLKNYFSNLREKSDAMFENRWMWNDLLHDILLLENQLPMKVAEGLLRFVDRSFLKKLTIYNLAHEFFKNVGNTAKLPLTENCYRANHFLEFLLYLHWPASARVQPLPSDAKFEHTRCATELQQAGVVFRCGSDSSFFTAEFNDGVLTIPSFTVNELTETFFRNIIAFEQHTIYSKDITSYVVLMDDLINTGEDVVLLAKHGIIRNELGESKAVADLFNSLHREVMTDASVFYFAELCGELNAYSRNCFHELKARCFNWRRMLCRDYFSNPWSLISVIAATLLLCLTVTQTVLSFIQVKQGANSSSGN